MEGTFVEETFPGLEEKKIKPLIDTYIKTDSVSLVKCLSLLETTADKSSALVWRVLSRKRDTERDDPTIIRHIYDLHGLLDQLDNPKHIIEAAKARFQRDRGRGNDLIPESFDNAVVQAIQVLSDDPLYKEEYSTYVLNMCFGSEAPPSFEIALQSFTSLNTRARDST